MVWNGGHSVCRQKFMDKAEWAQAVPHWRNKILKSTLYSFQLNIFLDTKGVNVLMFVYTLSLNKFITQFCGWKIIAAATPEAIKMTGLLFRFVQTCLAFFTHGDECLLHSWCPLLGLWVILLNTCLITYDNLQVFWASLKSLLIALAYADMILLLLFTWQVEQNWLPIWYMFRLSFEMLQMKFPTCKDLHRQWFFHFQEKVPPSIQIIICFVHQWWI